MKQSDKYALITGGSSGLGLAIAKRLASQGYNLVLVSRNEEKLAAARQSIFDCLKEKAGQATETGNTAGPVVIRIFPLDLSETSAPQRLHDWTTVQGIKPDILVNDAGMYIYRSLCEIPEETQSSLIALNITALTSLCRLYGMDMAQENEGKDAHTRYILNIASYSVYMPIEGFSLYASSKAFVRTFSRCIAKELRHKGVKVTAVAPAGMDTNLMNLKPGIRKLARSLGFLASTDTIARISLRAMKTRGLHYWIPLWFNALFIPFLWMFQPLFKKVL